jgi:hypothetical protein
LYFGVLASSCTFFYTLSHPIPLFLLWQPCDVAKQLSLTVKTYYAIAVLLNQGAEIYMCVLRMDAGKVGIVYLVRLCRRWKYKSQGYTREQCQYDANN